MTEFKRCAAPGCDRLVRPCVAYCCEGCRNQVPREGYLNGEIDYSTECWIRHGHRTTGPQQRKLDEERKEKE